MTERIEITDAGRAALRTESLWILRHAGAVVACAPDSGYLGAFRCIADALARNEMSQADYWALYQPVMHNANERHRYEHNGYTLALEPHPTPGET